jgi:hypothetical protein
MKFNIIELAIRNMPAAPAARKISQAKRALALSAQIHYS